MPSLLKKDIKFRWTPTADNAFRSLKAAFTSVSMIAHFDPSLPCILETNASDIFPTAVLSQKDNQRVLHPVALYSHKMTLAECNYKIYDKELLAIVWSFEDWRKYHEPCDTSIIVYCDHKNLEYFMTSKILNYRQGGWALTQTTFKFVIIYRPGPPNGKPNTLTRPSGDLPEKGDESLPQQQQVLLKPVNLRISNLTIKHGPPILHSATN